MSINKQGIFICSQKQTGKCKNLITTKHSFHRLFIFIRTPNQPERIGELESRINHLLYRTNESDQYNRAGV